MDRIPTSSSCSPSPSPSSSAGIADPMRSSTPLSNAEHPHFFFEFSLCLSRACLGKMIIFRYQWRKKTDVSAHCCPVSKACHGKSRRFFCIQHSDAEGVCIRYRSFSSAPSSPLPRSLFCSAMSVSMLAWASQRQIPRPVHSIYVHTRIQTHANKRWLINTGSGKTRGKHEDIRKRSSRFLTERDAGTIPAVIRLALHHRSHRL